MEFARTLPTAFLTGIKTRKGKGKKEEERKEFFLYARLIQLFFLYIGTADRLTPLVGVATAPQPAPLSVGEGVIFFLNKNEHSDLHHSFFLIFLKKKGKKKEKKEKREEGGKAGKRRIIARKLCGPIFLLKTFIYSYTHFLS